MNLLERIENCSRESLFFSLKFDTCKDIRFSKNANQQMFKCTNFQETVWPKNRHIKYALCMKIFFFDAV